jgi:DNA-binding transcriptional LysR family regulator
MALVAPRPMAEASGLAVFDLPFESPLLGSVLYWRRTNAEDPAMTWLRGVFREASKGL